MRKILRLLLIATTLFLIAISKTGDAANAYASLNVGNSINVINSAFQVIANPGVGTAPGQSVLTSDGKFLYVINKTDTTVSVIETDNNTLFATISIAPFNPSCIAITADGQKVLVGDNGGNVSFIHTDTNTISTVLPLNAGMNFIAITSDNVTAYAVNNDLLGVKVLDVASESLSTALQAGTNPSYVAITPDNSKAFIVNSSNDVTVVNATSVLALSIPTQINPTIVAIAPNGEKAYVPNFTSQSITVIDVASLTPLAPIPLSTNPFFLAITPDGSKAYVTNLLDNSVTALNLSSLATQTIAVGTQPLQLAITTDSALVYVANNGGGGVSVIDTAQDAVVETIATVGGNPFFITLSVSVPTLGLSPQGKQVKNRFLTQSELVNQVSWSAPRSGFTPVNYLIYRDASLTQLAAQVPANFSLQFNDHNRKKGVTYSYFIVATNSQNQTLNIGTVVIAPN